MNTVYVHPNAANRKTLGHTDSSLRNARFKPDGFSVDDRSVPIEVTGMDNQGVFVHHGCRSQELLL